MNEHGGDAENEALSANSLANWSFFGIIIPVVGWILGVMALLKVKQLKPNTAQEHIQLQNIRAKAWWSIAIAIASFFIGISIKFYFYNGEKVQVPLNQQNITETQNSQLDACLNTAEQSYENYLRINASETKVDPDTGQTLYKNDQHTTDNAKSKLQADRDECFKRYPVKQN
jgi:hypothetical protein